MKKYLTKEGIEYNSFIYIWKDNLLYKYYIGSHVGNIEDGYLFGGIDIKKEYKQRPEDFERMVLSYHIINEYKEIRDIEKKYLIKYDVENKDEFYNRTNESYGGYHKKSVEKRLLDIDENGLNAFQRASKKMVETRKSKNSYATAKIKEYKTKKLDINKSNKTKEKISNTLKGNKWVNKNGTEKIIRDNEFNNFKLDGWIDGRLTSKFKWINKENTIKFIKSNELEEYKLDGWTEGKNTLHKVTYTECSNFAKKMNITSCKKWFEIAIKNNMPFHPERIFKNEWKGWNTFLQK